LGEANVLAALCRLSLQSGDVDAAEEQLKKVVAIRRMIGDLYGEGADYFNFALVLLKMGEREKAKEYASRARSVFERVGEPGPIQQTDALIDSIGR
jgi:tetratricopeptide (TPR) repeat protein